MIQSLRNIKLRMKSVENTEKITRAMEMVSASKLNRMKNILYTARPYFSKVEVLMRNVLKSADMPDHPLLKKRSEARSIAIFVVTSDAGLCGVYNHNMIRLTEEFVARKGKDAVELIAIGREAFNYFKRAGYRISEGYGDLHSRYSVEVASEIAESLKRIFLDGKADEVYAAYTRFDSTLRHKPVVEKLLNIESSEMGGVEYIAEPDMASVLDELFSWYLHERIRIIILNSFTSEHSARMIAMKMATDNAKDLMDSLTLSRNKARQAMITKEVIEIASSAEALKGPGSRYSFSRGRGSADIECDKDRGSR
ncbi:MAG: ATP synthase F1 subunit gamma [Candidatus Omnitrophica bacterium]|nr:ATP synthase F1 subunit gamma [Candidatus Omnitrophota bacterium]